MDLGEVDVLMSERERPAGLVVVSGCLLGADAVAAPQRFLRPRLLQRLRGRVALVPVNTLPAIDGLY